VGLGLGPIFNLLFLSFLLIQGIIYKIVAELGCSAGLVIANAVENERKFHNEEVCFWWHCSWISNLYQVKEFKGRE
jgi:hypothetical protein